MISRALGAVILAATVGYATPWTAPTVPATPEASSSASTDPQARLRTAVENATHRHVPGSSGSGWVLQGLERSGPGMDGREFIVATGVITDAGAPDTLVRLTGQYDPRSGELARVSYRLQPATRIAPAPANPGGWRLQHAVEQAFAEVLPDAHIDFALESAQSSRVEGGGRRFEGAGIGTWGEGDARFVVFTMTLSSQGELVEFDYGTQPGGDADTAFVAGH